MGLTCAHLRLQSYDRVKSLCNPLVIIIGACLLAAVMPNGILHLPSWLMIAVWLGPRNDAAVSNGWWLSYKTCYQDVENVLYLNNESVWRELSKHVFCLHLKDFFLEVVLGIKHFWIDQSLAYVKLPSVYLKFWCFYKYLNFFGYLQLNSQFWLIQLLHLVHLVDRLESEDVLLYEKLHLVVVSDYHLFSIFFSHETALNVAVHRFSFSILFTSLLHSVDSEDDVEFFWILFEFWARNL